MYSQSVNREYCHGLIDGLSLVFVIIQDYSRGRYFGSFLAN
jgi:hypothetical protein